MHLLETRINVSTKWTVGNDTEKKAVFLNTTCTLTESPKFIKGYLERYMGACIFGSVFQSKHLKRKIVFINLRIQKSVTFYLKFKECNISNHCKETETAVLVCIKCNIRKALPLVPWEYSHVWVLDSSSVRMESKPCCWFDRWIGKIQLQCFALTWEMINTK